MMADLRERIAAFVCPQGRIAGLLQEIEHHKAAAEGRWEDFYLMHAGPLIRGKGGFEIAMRSPVSAVLVEHMARMLESIGAENWVEVEAFHKKHGALVLTVARARGETPGQKIARLEAELAAVKARLSDGMGRAPCPTGQLRDEPIPNSTPPEGEG
jgi:hypothetical protein